MRRLNNIKECAEKVGIETPDWASDGNKMDVYYVPISKLFYNDENGRISTWISSDKELYPDVNYDNLELIEYNNKIHEFIKLSNNSDTFKKTYNDILIKGQIKPGVILADGRVVSGNRRFTVLRELYKNTASEKFAYFKCFILDKNLENMQDRKYIKTIERLTQFGVDEKVDYDPIARLVDIYNDLIMPGHIWTIEEYTKKFDLKKSDVETMYYKALIMADFLEYLNKPNKFHFARQLKLDGPLQELIKIYKIIDVSEWNRIRVLFYSSMSEKGDRTRDIRSLIKVYKTNINEFNNLLKKCINDVEDNEFKNFTTNNDIRQNESFVADPKTISTFTQNDTDTKTIDDAIVNPVLSDDTKTAIFVATYATKIEAVRAEKVKKITANLEYFLRNIDDAYSIMNNMEKSNLKNSLAKIKTMINELESKE